MWYHCVHCGLGSLDRHSEEGKVGWVDAGVRTNHLRWGNVSKHARRLLKLTPEQSERLFHDESWPLKFAKPYYNLNTGGIWATEKDRKKAAKIAIRRIDHFIKTKGKE